jgi:chromosome segregation ATPase
MLEGKTMDTGVVAIIIAIVTLIPSTVALFLQRRGDVAKAKESEAKARSLDAEIIRIASVSGKENVDTAMSFIRPLKEKIAELEAELKQMSSKLNEIEALLDEKESQIMELKKEMKLKDLEIDMLKSKVASLEREVEYLKKGNGK